MLTDKELDAGKDPSRYYYALGLQHDELLRCKDCSRLVLHSDLKKRGSCKCGNRRVMEITTLSLWEMLRIRLGLLRFRNSAKFLREFGCEW